MRFEPAAWLQRLKRYLRGFFTVSAWRRFARDVRSENHELLKCLKNYPDSVLVAGCQRSGTTMLARLFTGSEGMVDYYFGVDDEHDAALLLVGQVSKPKEGRYCFQTTYLNECYREYIQNDAALRLIWVVRNPYSVVCSFLYNWERFALNELFLSCGVDKLEAGAKRRYERFGILGLSCLERACYAYSGKTGQALELATTLPADRFLVVDYDSLVSSKDLLLPYLYRYIDLTYVPDYASRVHARSLDKASRLSPRERALIDRLCSPVYDKVAKLAIDADTAG